MANRQSKLRIGVVLTAEARKVLRSEPIQLFLKEGQYFNCDSISQDGFFLNMKLKLPEEGELVHEIAIPISYVLYMVSAEAQTRLGFNKESKSE
jgi:hypothetical protein